jgi:hypothetical protein
MDETSLEVSFVMKQPVAPASATSMFAFYEYGYYSVYFGGAINFYLNDTCLVKGKVILSTEAKMDLWRSWACSIPTLAGQRKENLVCS